MRRILFLVISFFSISTSYAQNGTIKGVAIDATNQKPLPGATISILLQSDSTLVKVVASSTDGVFNVYELPADSLILTITSVGYQQFVSFITLDSSNNYTRIFDALRLNRTDKNDLQSVTVISRTPPVTQKGDTSQYSASQFKVNPDATTEDLIKKMPGITVDKAGTVTAQGEQVRSVTVDGKKFFGDDATAALRNLPAEIVDKIQVFDRLSDQAQFTGLDDGNAQRSINIVTKSASRNGQFGRLYAGYGTDDRYSAGGNVSFFKGDRRISLVGLFNNINQQNFAAEDLLGVSGSNSGGSRGGGGNRGGGSRNFGGNNNNFTVGQQNGISATNAFGINYSDKWGNKMEVSGSYFFNNSNTNNNQISNSQYFLQNSANQFYDENSISSSENYNNRLNLRMEFKIDSSNSLIFSPSVSFQNNNASNLVTGSRYFTSTSLISSTDYKRNAKNSGYNTNNNLLFRHAFQKKGRTISFNLGYAKNNRVGDTYLESINRYYNTGISNDSLQQYTDQLVNGDTYSANVAYTEPIGKKAQLQFNLSPSVSKNKSDQAVYQYDNGTSKYSSFDTTLSNKFDNTTTSHTASVSYRKGDRDNMIAFGLSYKYTGLESQQIFPQFAKVNKSFNNILPNAMFRKKFNARESVNIFYRSSTNPPSVTQLQNVVNNNNPLFLTTGNPDLKQQFSNVLSTRYTYTNTAKGKSFFANIFVQQATNYIANGTYIARTDSVIDNGTILQRGSQLTKPVNMNGYVSLRSFLTYGMPVKFIKSNLNMNGGFSWSKIPGLVNDVKSVSENFTYTAGAVVSSNISERVDFNISYNANYSVVRNTLQPLLNNDYLVQVAGAQLNLLSKKGWFIQNDVSNQSYSGLSAGFNQNYWLWNAAIGKKFMKNKAGELKLSVFDLLKQNRSITRNVTESYVEDVQNLVLTQYLMLTFSYKLKNFGTAKTSAQGSSGGGQMQGRPAGGSPSF